VVFVVHDAGMADDLLRAIKAVEELEPAVDLFADPRVRNTPRCHS